MNIILTFIPFYSPMFCSLPTPVGNIWIFNAHLFFFFRLSFFCFHCSKNHQKNELVLKPAQNQMFVVAVQNAVKFLHFTQLDLAAEKHMDSVQYTRAIQGQMMHWWYPIWRCWQSCWLQQLGELGEKTLEGRETLTMTESKGVMGGADYPKERDSHWSPCERAKDSS